MLGKARTRLILIVLVVQAIAVVTYVVVNERWTEQAVVHQMDEILDLAAKDATADVDAYVRAIETASSQVISAVTEAGDDTSRAERSMYYALEYVPHLSGAYVGTADGSFLYVRSDGDGYVTKRIAVASERVVTLVERAEDYSITGTTSDPLDEYDPSQRPWFSAAQDAGGSPVWTAPYVFFTSQQPGITRAALIPGDGPDKVAGVDFELSALVELVDQLSSDISGEVTIRTPDGLLLTRQGVFGPDETPADLSPRVNQLAGRSLSDIPDNRIEYDIDGTGHVAYFAEVGPVGDEWLLTLDLSEADVVAPILSVFAKQRWLAITIGALAVFMMALMLRSPIRRLELESQTDALTELPNRREILRRGMDLAAEQGGYVLAMIDVDHFKSVNDRFGHAVGDEVLQGIAERLAARTDLSGRLGGEEFLIALPPNSWNANQSVLERVRANLASQPIATSAGPIDVTISVGVKTHRSGETFSEVLNGADLALLAAKEQGRNRLVHFAQLDGESSTPDSLVAGSRDSQTVVLPATASII